MEGGIEEKWERGRAGVWGERGELTGVSRGWEDRGKIHISITKITGVEKNIITYFENSAFPESSQIFPNLPNFEQKPNTQTSSVSVLFR